MTWNVRLRPAIHEVGHVVVEYVLRGTARDCYCYDNEDGSHGGQTGELTDTQPTQDLTAEDHINLAAEFFGGWAAVHLAISNDFLPSAPTSIEATPGDFGYIGSDEEFVKKLVTIADPADPSAAEDKARTLALDILRPRMSAVRDLAACCVDAGYVSSEMVVEAIAREP